jgi:hypothetical protein
MPSSAGVGTSKIPLIVSGAATATVAVPVGRAGTVKQIYVTCDVKPTSAVLNLYKTGAISLMAAATTLQSLTTAQVAEAQTLATAPTTLRVAASDCIVAVTTVTTAGSMTSVGVMVEIEWDTW